MSDEMSVEDIQTNLCSIVTGHEEKEKWEYVAGFNAAVAILMPQVQLRDAKVAMFEKVLRIIAMRTKMENFVDKNYPLRFNDKTKETVYGKPEKMSYCDAIHEMLTSEHSRFTSDVFVMMIRQRLTENSITVSVFMKFCRWLYNQFSDKSCHKMAKYASSLPSYDDTEGIKTMFKDVKIRDVIVIDLNR